MLDPLTAVSHTPKLWMGKGRPVSSSTHIHTEDHFLHIHTPQTHLLYRHGFMYSSAAVAPPQPPTAVAPPRRSHSSRRFSRIITRTSLYDLLGVSSSASTADIRSAYRRLAARYHPDVNSSIVAHEKFQASSRWDDVVLCESVPVSVRSAADTGDDACLMEHDVPGPSATALCHPCLLLL